MAKALSKTEQEILGAIVVVTRAGLHTAVQDLAGLSDKFHPSKHVTKLVRLDLVARTPGRRGYCYATPKALFPKAA